MRSATQRIRVLDFLGNHILRHIEIQGFTNFLCRKAKSRMRFCFEQAFIIVIRIALHRNRNHRSNSTSKIRKVFRTRISHASNCVHRRSTVHDSNRFFRAELVRGNSQFLHHVQRRTSFTLVHHIAFANHGTRQIRKRSQVATCPHGTFLRNKRQNIVLQKLRNDFQKRIAHARETLRKRIQAHRHNCTGCLCIKIIAETASMKTRQVDRELAVMFRRQHLRAGITISCCHAINATMFCKRFVQEFCTRINLSLEFRRTIKFHCDLLFRNRNNIFNRELTASNNDGFHLIVLHYFSNLSQKL